MTVYTIGADSLSSDVCIPILPTLNAAILPSLEMGYFVVEVMVWEWSDMIVVM